MKEHLPSHPDDMTVTTDETPAVVYEAARGSETRSEQAPVSTDTAVLARAEALKRLQGLLKRH